jgi:putative phosphoribosyl transferase
MRRAAVATAWRGQQLPARMIVAVPLAPPETCNDFRDEVDEIVCAIIP